MYQIKVVLSDTKPRIWRKLLVPSDVLLGDLHKMLQTAMGWTNSHLHQFIKDGDFYVPPAPEDMLLDPFGRDYTCIQLNDFLKKPKEQIIYEYDFGDGWQHEITLEKILPEEEAVTIPVCVGGARHCPPEDSGGPWGYAELLEILKDPSHYEYEMYSEWMSEDFDPEHFDLEQINETLKQEDFGCITFF